MRYFKDLLVGYATFGDRPSFFLRTPYIIASYCVQSVDWNDGRKGKQLPPENRLFRTDSFEQDEEGGRGATVTMFF